MSEHISQHSRHVLAVPHGKHKLEAEGRLPDPHQQAFDRAGEGV